MNTITKVAVITATAWIMSQGSAHAADPWAQVNAAGKLAKENNHREAVEALKPLLADQDAAGKVLKEALALAVKSSVSLGDNSGAETLIEDAARIHAGKWQVLEAAGKALESINHYGQIVDGKFTRAGGGGSRRFPWGGPGQWASSLQRDHVRALQLLMAARDKLPANAEPQERGALFDELIAAWRQGAGDPWKLQVLTDLKTLPEPETQTYGTAGGNRGYPVDADGNPVFFSLPASYETAANDGERLRFALQEWGGLGPANAIVAKDRLARLGASWFGVHTVAGSIGGQGTEEKIKQAGGIAALHTLADDETVARLATGPRRFKLPAEYAFIPRFREVAAAAPTMGPLIGFQVGGVAQAAVQQVVEELRGRHQFEAAATELKRAIENESDKKHRASLTAQLDQIIGNKGRFDSKEAQPAGVKARLPLLFRNATQVSLTAREVKVSQILEDTKAYLKSKPANQEWNKVNLSGISRRLLEKNGGQYLGKVVAEWKQPLEPAAHHWDKRIELETPLTQAGAYWVEARFEGGETTRALLWIEGLTIVETKRPTGSLYFVCDAATGAPVPEAKVEFFEYKMEWKDSAVFRKRPGYEYSFKESSGTTDAQGVIKTDHHTIPEDYQWQCLVTARDAAGRMAYSGFEGSFSFGPSLEDNDVPRIYVISDRPVYRPGQEVKWKFWARKVGYDPKLKTNEYAGKACEVIVTNQRNEKVWDKEYRADDSGAVEDMLKLPENATLGSYQISITFDKNQGPYGNHSFRVEEYKKPEFEVKVEAPEKPVALGDSFEFKIKADYYFGGAVREGRVKYKVSRTPYTDQWFPSGRWDWLFGAGYNWRSLSYGWYPGSQNWSVCVPRWPWMTWHRDPPEIVAEGEAPLGADGTVKVKIDSALAKAVHGDQDHRYELEAEVTDNSRRTLFGSGSVLAARRPFEAYAWLDRGWYQTGDAAELSISSRTLDGKSVTASGRLRVLKLSYAADGTPHEEEAAAFDIRTGGEEATTQTLKWSGPGQYRLAISLKDQAGHESQTSVFTVVRGEGIKDTGFRYDDLELVTAKDEYQPGDDVEVLINANRPGSTVALSVRAEKSGDPVWLHLDGKSASYHFKLSEADQPNIFLEAYTVSNARLHKITRQIIVPPSKRIATVEHTTSKPTYLPRDKASAKLVVKDQNGKPFVGQVVITAYDKALEYISGGSNQPDIRPFFWGWRRAFSSETTDVLHALEIDYGRWTGNALHLSGVNTYSGATTVTMSGAAGVAMAPAAVADEAAPSPRKSKAMAPSGAFARASGPAAPETPAVMIRSNLADSAVWLGSVTTNAEGEASIDFPMPDNLTTWKLKSWVMGPDTQVGEAAVEVITRKDLMVRLQAPRFFVEKDEVTISANVHNELDKTQDVEALLEIIGSGASLRTLEGDKPAGLHESIAAHSEHRFDWRLKTTGSGKVTVRVKALAQADSDAMEMTFPVYEHGTLKTDSWSLGLRPDQASGELSFTVPEDRKPEMTKLEVRCSPTLAMALVDALPYLSGYPYGCTEQTLNRFVPTVVTLGVLKDLGLDLKQVHDKRVNLNAQEIGDVQKRGLRWQGKDGNGRPKEAVFDEEEVMKMAHAGLERLTAMCNGDGGWGWFPGGRESSAHMTALVAHGLLAAKAAGLKLDDDLLNSGLHWLQNHEVEEVRKLQLPEKDEHHKSRPDNTDALVHSVLAQTGKASANMHKPLYEHRGDLSHYNLALLGLACDAMHHADERDMCLRNLRQFLKQDEENQTAWLELPDNGWWWWYDDPIETQATFLRLLVAVEPKSDLAPRLAKYLLNNRRNGTYWNSTRDTATVIEALAAFIKASGESKPDMQLDVLVDGVVKKQVTVSKDNLFSFDGTLLLASDEIKSGKHSLEFRKQGGSPLYANAYLTLFSKEDMIPAAGLEVKIERRFYKLTEQKQTTNVSGSHGQVIAQQGVKYKRTELASGDALTSGDLVEVELSVESKNDYEYLLIADPKPAGFEPVEVQSGWSYQGLAAFKEFRDEKVAFFVERLPRGRFNLSYRVKAEIPGKFSALPTKAEAMYAPELRGNAAEWKAVINDR